MTCPFSVASFCRDRSYELSHLMNSISIALTIALTITFCFFTTQGFFVNVRWSNHYCHPEQSGAFIGDEAKILLLLPACLPEAGLPQAGKFQNLLSTFRNPKLVVSTSAELCVNSAEPLVVSVAETSDISFQKSAIRNSWWACRTIRNHFISTTFPPLLIDSVAASSTFTTRSPLSPSLLGLFH